MEFQTIRSISASPEVFVRKSQRLNRFVFEDERPPTRPFEIPSPSGGNGLAALCDLAHGRGNIGDKPTATSTNLKQPGWIESEMGYDRFATSMSITLQNAIAELRQTIPSFTVDPEYGAEGLSYLVFSDFARFICSEAEVLKYVESDEEAIRLSMVPACMAFLERVIEEGDSAVHDLVDDCVESLSACQWQEQIRAWTKPHIAAIWKRYL